MDLHDGKGTVARFRAYAADRASVLGHSDRVRPFETAISGCCLPRGRKSVEPPAAKMAGQICTVR
jgi:SRSO17 transposase